jgi:hypothetical protein
MAQRAYTPYGMLPETVSTNDARILTYNAAIAKGQSLHDMMWTNNDTPTSMANPPQGSAFLEHTSLQDWGYVRTIDTHEGKPSVYWELGKHIPALNIISLHCRRAVTIHDSHKQRTVHYGKVYSVTYAAFSNIIDRNSGILVATSNCGPAHVLAMSGRQDERRPDLQQWSDIAYLQWSDPSLAHLLNDLKYVVRSSIVNCETIAVIERVVANYREVDENWRLYPGSYITWDIEDDDAKALLGTPNGNGVAWLLAQHKRELGWKVVQSVTVFWDNLDVIDAGDKPSLLFWLEDVQGSGNENSATIEDLSEAFKR